MIIGQITRDRQSRGRVVVCLFFQGHTDSRDNSPENLAPASLRIYDTAAIHHTYPARHTDERQIGINFDFAKMRTPALKSELFVLLKLKFTLRLQHLHAGPVQSLTERIRLGRISTKIGELLF